MHSKQEMKRRNHLSNYHKNNKQIKLSEKQWKVKNLQGIGMLDISFKHFQGVLERLSHGSYVHLPENPKKQEFFLPQSKIEEDPKKKKGIEMITQLTHQNRTPIKTLRKNFSFGELPKTPEVSLSSLSLSNRSGLSLSDTVVWKGASCCFYSVLESEDGEVERTRGRWRSVTTSNSVILLQKNIKENYRDRERKCKSVNKDARMWVRERRPH